MKHDVVPKSPSMERLGIQPSMHPVKHVTEHLTGMAVTIKSTPCTLMKTSRAVSLTCH